MNEDVLSILDRLGYEVNNDDKKNNMKIVTKKGYLLDKKLQPGVVYKVGPDEDEERVLTSYCFRDSINGAVICVPVSESMIKIKTSHLTMDIIEPGKCVIYSSLEEYYKGDQCLTVDIYNDLNYEFIMEVYNRDYCVLSINHGYTGCNINGAYRDFDNYNIGSMADDYMTIVDRTIEYYFRNNGYILRGFALAKSGLKDVIRDELENWQNNLEEFLIRRKREKEECFEEMIEAKKTITKCEGKLAIYDKQIEKLEELIKIRDSRVNLK